MRRRGKGWTNHGSVSDQSNESVRGKEGEGDDDGFLESLEVVVIETGIDYEEEDGRDLSGTTESVFDRRVPRE
jgi:hypothetical protein